MTKIPVEWFAKYMQHIANNIVGRDGQIRFSYKQLRHTLDVIEHGREDIDPEVRELMIKVIGVLPPLELSDRQITTLCLALLNCHMAYHLTNPDLIGYIEESWNERRRSTSND